ncbi:hypothetical protein V8F06_008097 [Rhypophila decipiens]
MAATDGQDNNEYSRSGGGASTVKSALSKQQSSTHSRTRSRSGDNRNRRGMIPSQAEQRALSTLGGEMIPIALSLSNTPESSSPPLPSRTNNITTFPDPGPSVAARGITSRARREDMNKRPMKQGAQPTIANKTYTSSAKKSAPTPSQYSPSIYNAGDDWTRVPSPPVPVPALPTLAATTYSPRSGRTDKNSPRNLKIKSPEYDANLEPKPLSTPRTRPKADPRDERETVIQTMNEKPLPARPALTATRKRTIKDISVPISPAAPPQYSSLGTTLLGTSGTRGRQPIEPTKMIKIKTQQVARKQPQVVQVKSPLSATTAKGPISATTAGGAIAGTMATSSSKVAALARAKSRVTRIMSFGGTPATTNTANNNNKSTTATETPSPDGEEGAGGGWWDMLDNIIPGPLKPPPRTALVITPAAANSVPARNLKVPEMRTIPGGSRKGKQAAAFDPGNMI